MYGKKKAFLSGLILYGIGTLAATFAPNSLFLIGGWSVVRALGMALAIPASIGLIFATYIDERQRAQAFAIYGAGAVAAALVGPLLMGLSADFLSWRVPFALETVVAAGAFFLALKVIRETKPQAGASIDWIGTVINFFAIAAILLGSMLGGRYGWVLPRRPFTLGGVELNPLGLSPAPLLTGLGILLMAFLLSRLTRMTETGAGPGSARPLFSMKLFDDRTFFVASLMATIFYVLAGALPFILPVFLQQTIRFDGLQTAITMMAFSVGSIVFGFASGSLMQRMQGRTVMQLFLLVAAAGVVWLFVVVGPNVSLGQLLLPMLVMGAGFGVVSAQIPNIQLSKLSAELRGEGSGFAETGKELGIGLGTAVIASIMFGLALSGSVDGIARHANVSLSPEQRNELIVKLEDETLPDEAAKIVKETVPNLESVITEANVEAFQITLGILATLLLLALLVASIIPKVDPEEATAPEMKQKVADVSSKRL
jgi:MFS family permease